MIDRKVFVRLLLTIGLPIVLQQIISLSLNMIDTFMIGSIGVGELAAVGAANKVYLYSPLSVLEFTAVRVFMYPSTGESAM